MRTHFMTIVRRVFAYLSGAYGIFVFIRDECLPENISQNLKLGNLIGKYLKMDNLSWFWFLLLAIVLYIPEIVNMIKKILQGNSNLNLNFIPRSGKIHEGLWEPYYAWLEVVGNGGYENFVAILRKLESKKDEAITNRLVQVTKSSSPRLRIVDEKIFIAETDVTDVLISLKVGKSKPLPKDTSKFYFEIELIKGNKSVGAYKGYLVGGYPDLHIKSY